MKSPSWTCPRTARVPGPADVSSTSTTAAHTGSVAERQAAGKDLGGRRQTFTDSQIRNALRLVESREPATQVARDLGMSRATLYRWIPELSLSTSG